MKNYIDSSDEEEAGYSPKTSIFDKLKAYQESLDIDNFKIYLSLMLNYLADRLFKQSSINDKYKHLKKTHLELTQDEKKLFKEVITTLLPEGTNEIGGFNSLFSPYNKTLKDEQKSSIKEKIKNHTENFTFLNKHLPTLSSGYQEDASNILALSKVINRANKNIVKFLTLQNTPSHAVSNNYKLTKAALGQFTNAYELSSKNFTISSEVKGIGNYSDIFLKINKLDNIAKKQFVNRIKAVIQNKNAPKVSESEDDDNFTDQVTNLLFITEMQRDISTVFMAPMTFELLSKDNEYITIHTTQTKKSYKGKAKEQKLIEAIECPENIFPMAYSPVVARIRQAIKAYHKELPNTHIMDYDQDPYNNGNGAKYRKFLFSKAELLIKWIKSVGYKKYPSLQFLDLDFLKELYTLKQFNDFDIDTHNVLTILDIAKCLKKIGYKDLNKLDLEQLSNQLNLSEYKLKAYTLFQDSNKDEALGKNVKDLLDVFKKNQKTFSQDIARKLDQFKKADLSLALTSILTELSILLKDYYNINFNFKQFLKADSNQSDNFDEENIGQCNLDIGGYKISTEELGADPRELFSQATKLGLESRYKIDNKTFEIVKTKGGGDCALHAIKGVIETEGNVSLIRQQLCNNIKIFIELYKLGLDFEKKETELDNDHKVRVDNIIKNQQLVIIGHYKNIFAQSFDVFKAVITQLLKKPLNDPDTNPETKLSINNVINNLHGSWKNIAEETWDYIITKKTLLDIDVKAILEDHIKNILVEKADNLCEFKLFQTEANDIQLNKFNNWQDWKSSEDDQKKQILERVDISRLKCIQDGYYSYASQDGVWLNNSEINSYLMQRGYVFESNNDLGFSNIHIHYVSTTGQDDIYLRNESDIHWSSLKTRIELQTIFSDIAQEEKSGKDISFIIEDLCKKRELIAKEKGRKEAKIEMLFKDSIKKLQKHFAKNKEEKELYTSEIFLGKKRVLKQLDKEQKWGNTPEQKFKFITEHLKSHFNDKTSKIYDDLKLSGESMDLENASDYSEWSHID